MTKLRFTSPIGRPDDTLILCKLMRLISPIFYHAISPHAVVHLAVSDKSTLFVRLCGTSRQHFEVATT